MKVYERSRQNAVRQISIRLSLIRFWVSAGIPWRKSIGGEFQRDADGELLLDYIPRNISDFANWTSADHSPGTQESIFIFPGESDEHVETSIALSDLKPISRTTLTQPYHEALRRDTLVQLKAICSKAQVQLDSSRKTSVIDLLRSEYSLLKKVVAEQEKEVRTARMEALKARVDLQSCQQIAKNNIAEQRRNIESLEQRIAELVRDFSKISPIGKIKEK